MFLIAAGGGRGLHTISEFCCTSQLPGAGNLCGKRKVPELRRAPYLVQCPVVDVLKFLVTLNKGPHAHIFISHWALQITQPFQSVYKTRTAKRRRWLVPTQQGAFLQGARPGQSYCHEA